MHKIHVQFYIFFYSNQSMVNMEGSKKVKRVTWASDLDLCQVRMFLVDESPSEVAIGTQDHLQAKASGSALHEVLASYANLPPGFEGLQHANSWRAKLSQIPLVKWKFPTRFQVNRDWSVVAGEESTEVECQNQRELGILEAIYPRPSAIPPNPSGLDTAEYANNAELTPVIPLTPIEEEDTSMDLKPGFNPAGNVQSGHGASDAMATLTSIIAGTDQGNLIDRELLIKILSDPKMVEQLVASHGRPSDVQSMPSSTQILTPSSSFPSFSPSSKQQDIPSSGASGTQPTRLQILSPQYVPTVRPSPMAPLTSVTTHIPRPDVIPATGTVIAPPFFPPGSIPNLRHPPAEVVSTASPSMAVPGMKDINYYKSLIQQHGGERREPTPTPQFNIQSSQEQTTAMGKSRESKPKILKPCMFFNTSKGCRNGGNCPFLHELVPQLRVGTSSEVPSTKRLKLDSEITGS